jgi:hypothetical protein
MIIEEDKRILSELVKEKQAIKNLFYKTLNGIISEWIKKKT